MPPTTHQDLLQVLRDTREFLARPSNDFTWASWDRSEDALRQMDDLIRRIEAGEMSDFTDITVLFAPTGDIQEVAESSGWGKDFLSLAERCDAAIESISPAEKTGKPTRPVMNHRVTVIYRYGTRSVLPILIIGIIAMTVATITGSKRGMNLGTFILSMAFVVWGISCGTAIIWAAVQTARETGTKAMLRDCLADPAVTILLIVELLFYLFLIFGGLWMILKILFLN